MEKSPKVGVQKRRGKGSGFAFRPSRSFIYFSLRTKRRHGEDEMDVDADEEEEGSGNSDADENGPNMSVDGDTAETPAANKKKSKKSKNKGKPRQSQVDLAALSTEQAAVAALDHKEVILLTMQKKYCAEALDFIRQIRTAMETMAQLLGSTHKPEVLEAMEFFRVAHEYRLEEAKVRRVVLYTASVL